MASKKLSKIIDGSNQEVKSFLLDPSFSNGVFDGVNALANEVLKDLFFSENWIFITVNLLADEMSMPELKVYKKLNNGGKITYEANETHSLQKLLDNPNANYDASAFIYNNAVEYFLGGNSICFYSRATRQIIQMPFERVTQEFNNVGMLTNYVVSDISGTGRSMRINPMDVIHIKRPNPSSVWWGLSPFIPSKKEILFHKYTKDYLNSYYEKGANPQIVLESETAANHDAMVRLLKSFESMYSGRNNARRTLVLPKGTKATPIQISIADQKIIDLINMNREDILNALRIPKHALGLQQAGSLGSEEFKTALKNMWSSVIMPALKRFAGMYTKFFAAELGESNVIDFDVSKIIILQDDLKLKAEAATVMLNTMTVNEVRSQVWELDPVEGGDVINSLKPVAPAWGQPQAPTQATPEPMPLLPEPTEQMLAGTYIDFDKYLEVNKELFEAHEKEVKASTDKAMTEMEKFALSHLLSQMEIAIKTVNSTIKSKASSEESKLKARLDKQFSDLSMDAQGNYNNNLNGQVELGYNTQLNMVYNKTAQEAVAAVGDQDGKKRSNLLQARGLKTFANIDQTSTDSIMQLVSTGLSTNQTVSEITRSIAKYFENNAWRRASTIARTETLSAVSIGQNNAVQNIKKVIPDIKKVWISANDERVRGNPSGLYPDAKSNHWELHGKAVDVDDDFEGGLGYPRDSRGAANQVINCRCTMVTLMPEDLNAMVRNGEIKPND